MHDANGSRGEKRWCRGTMADTSNMSSLHTAPAGRLPAMQASGASPVPGADPSLIAQLDPRLLEVRPSLPVLPHEPADLARHVVPVQHEQRLSQRVLPDANLLTCKLRSDASEWSCMRCQPAVDRPSYLIPSTHTFLPNF